MAINFISSESIPTNNENHFCWSRDHIIFDNPVDIKTFKESVFYLDQILIELLDLIIVYG